MKIKAKFKGANGSEGYENGRNYDLIFDVIGNQIWIFPGIVSPPARNVQYQSLKAFLNNWQVLN